MSQKQLQDQGSRLAHAAIFDLDPTALGEMVIRLGALSAALGHASVKSSAKDYVRLGPQQSAELHFLRDLFVKKPEDYVERWYGSMTEAGVFAGTGLALALDGTDDDRG